MARFRWCALGVLVALIGAPAGALSLGQVDDFETGTVLGWSGRSFPTHVATGGPDGSGDAFLRINAASDQLGTRHTTPVWTGNYAVAGITSIVLDLNNFGPDPVALRITLFSDTGAFTTTNEAVLAPGSGWVTVAFGLGPGDLTRTLGSGTLDQTLANVDTLLLRHDPDPISAPGQSNFVSATLGIDNITAVPEPCTALLLAAGLATLGASRR